jgi:hypothetical protein
MVVAVIALFVALGGSAAALSGSDTVQSDDLGPGSQVTAPDVAANAVNGSDVVDNSLSGADVNESTLGKVPNADKLDGLDSSLFIHGFAASEGNLTAAPGRIVSYDIAIPNGEIRTLFRIPDLVTVAATCNGTGAPGQTQMVNLSNSSNLSVLSDNGGTNPVLHRISPLAQIGFPDWDTAPGGEWLTFSFESAVSKVATGFAFSYAYTNPVTHNQLCQHQGQVIVKGA